FDGTSAASAALLYDSEPSARDVPAGSPEPARYQISVAAAGRPWLLHFAHSGGALVNPVGGQVWWVGCGGTLTSLLLAGLALSLVTTQANAGMIARRLTRDLSESEERWKFALEGAGDGVWDWDGETGKVFYSERWKEMLGYAGDESVVGHDEWLQRIHPEDMDMVRAQMSAHIADPSVGYNNEHRVRCKDGSWKWILTRGQAVSRDATGQVLRMIGTHKDISSRKHNEEEIARLSAIQAELTHLACAFINVPVAEQDVAIDQSLALMGRRLGVDRARLFDYDFPAGTVAATHEWCAPGVAATLTGPQLLALDGIDYGAAAHQRGEVVGLARVDVLPAGSPLRQLLDARGICSVITVPMMQGGNCLGFMSFEDLHDERVWREDEESLLRVLAELYANFEVHRRMQRASSEQQEGLRQARAVAEAAALAKGMFLANMSHEIRTPLNAILGYTQIMQVECSGCSQGRRVAAIGRSGEHLLTLVTDLLELVRSDTRPLELTPGDFDFYRLLEDVRLMFAVHPEAVGLVLDLHCAPEVPRFIRSDPGKLRQTLVNLVGNAFKFTKRGGVRLAASVEPGTVPDTVMIAVDVVDTGCGIAEHEMAH
ncbi:MAG: PAS domain-containing protein, partial [Verrucomicrobiota bacterium]